MGNTDKCCPNGSTPTGNEASAGIGTDVQRVEHEASSNGNHTHYQPSTDKIVEVRPN